MPAVPAAAGAPLCEDRWDAPCSGKLLPVTRYGRPFHVCERHADHRAKLGHPIELTVAAS